MNESSSKDGEERPARTGSGHAGPTSTELVFAMCHEISNAMAAVRLQAHLIDEELDAKGLAVASLRIDDLAARSSALLALVRPVLGLPKKPSLPVTGSALFSALSRTLEDQGGGGATLSCQRESDLPQVLADPEVIHFLMLAQIFCALEAVGQGGTVRVSAAREGAELVLAIEDDGPADEEHTDWRGKTLRGRCLCCAVADHVLARQAGRFSFERQGEFNRAECRLPVSGEAA